MSAPQDCFSKHLLQSACISVFWRGGGEGAERTRGRRVMQWVARQVGEEARRVAAREACSKPFLLLLPVSL